MNLYLLSQKENNDYDTYDSAVVAAESENAARLIHPNGYLPVDEWDSLGTWVQNPNHVSVKLIGTVAACVAAGVVLSSFNAG